MRKTPRHSMGAVRLYSRAFAFTVSDAIVRVRAYDTQYHDGAFFYELYDLLHAQVGLIQNGVIIRAGVTVGEAYVGINGEGPLLDLAWYGRTRSKTRRRYIRVLLLMSTPLPSIGAIHAYAPSTIRLSMSSRLSRACWLPEKIARATSTIFAHPAVNLTTSEAGQFSRSPCIGCALWFGPASDRRIARKFEWLARYHDVCVAELQREITSSQAMADELYEDGVTLACLRSSRVSLSIPPPPPKTPRGQAEIARLRKGGFSQSQGPHHAGQVCKRHRSPRSDNGIHCHGRRRGRRRRQSWCCECPGRNDTPCQSGTGTVYTGDVIEGKKVVSALDVNDLEPGKKHLLYFQGVKMPTGQHWYVSVTVAKGAKPGKRGVLTVACMATR